MTDPQFYRQQGNAYLKDEWKRRTARLAADMGMRVASVRSVFTFKHFKKLMDKV